MSARLGLVLFTHCQTVLANCVTASFNTRHWLVRRVRRVYERHVGLSWQRLVLNAAVWRAGGGRPWVARAPETADLGVGENQ